MTDTPNEKSSDLTEINLKSEQVNDSSPQFVPFEQIANALISRGLPRAESEAEQKARLRESERENDARRIKEGIGFVALIVILAISFSIVLSDSPEDQKTFAQSVITGIIGGIAGYSLGQRKGKP